MESLWSSKQIEFTGAPENILFEATKAEPAIITYAIRVLSGKDPTTFMTIMEPGKHLQALAMSCRDAETALEGLIKSYISP